FCHNVSRKSYLASCSFPPRNTMNADYVFDEDTLQALYQWVDEIPLSRPKRNMSRDFSDGVLMAEVMHHFFPRLSGYHDVSSKTGEGVDGTFEHLVQAMLAQHMPVSAPTQQMGGVDSMYADVERDLHDDSETDSNIDLWTGASEHTISAEDPSTLEKKKGCCGN
ncbi:hypothetical protein KIPB_010263, partial [Kipferlia bialata]